MDELALQKFGVGRLRVAEVEHYPGLGVTASPIHRKVDTDRGHPSGEDIGAPLNRHPTSASI